MNFIKKKNNNKKKLCNAFKKFSNIYLMLDLYTYQTKEIQENKKKYNCE